jgi:hypothetical protein
MRARARLARGFRGGAIALSLVSLPFLLPHVLEDFADGIAQRAGLSPGLAAALLGVGLALQMLGLILAGSGRRIGLAATALAGAVWTAGALWEHGGGLWTQGLGFRGSPLSALWLAGLILSQGFACLLALAVLLTGQGAPAEGGLRTRSTRG